MTDQLQRQNHGPRVRELTPDELAHVSAGTHVGGSLVALGDGSVRNVDAADYVVWRKTDGTGL